MAATYFDITMLPLRTIAGLRHRVRVTARNSDGSTDTGFVGATYFESSDPDAVLPYTVSSTYTFVGADAGVKDFFVSFSPGVWTLTALSGAISGTARTTTTTRPPGWGFDDEGILPYGDAAASIGSSLVKAVAYSTREVDVTVSNLVQDNSAFLDGDALNPSTWSVQRLDTTDYLHVVSVTQISTYTYRLGTFEEFGPVEVTHRVNTSTLLDMSGNVINSPRNADFLGLLDDTQLTFESRLAAQKRSVRDVANAQVPGFAIFAGTLQIDAGGDYQTVTGTELTKKLIIRRLITKPGDFFHLPEYGIGLRAKEPIPTSDLPKLKKAIEDQCLRETEVQAAQCTLTLDPGNGLLYVQVRVQEKKTGQQVDIGFKVNDVGVVL